MKVTCAIILSNQLFLIAKKPLHKKQGGKWEFPGGKLNSNESEEQCVVREIEEELLCQIQPIKKLQTIEHQYPEFKIELVPFFCNIVSGIPKLTEHTEIAWVSLSNIRDYTLCDADEKVIPILEDYLKKVP